MKKQVTIAEARNGLPGIVHRAERGQPVEITRRGRPVAVILSIHDYARIQASDRGFWKNLQAFLQKSDAAVVRGASDFADKVRDRGTGRRVKL